MRRIHRPSTQFTFILLFAGWLTALPLSGQVNSTWIGDGINNFSNGNWTDAARWNPQTVPNNNGGTLYSVTIPWYSGLAVFNGPQLNTDVTIQNLTLINRAFLDNQSDKGSNLTVLGTTSINTSVGHDGEQGVIWSWGGNYILGNLANYTAATHTFESGWVGAFQGGTVQFHGADIITNKGVISETGGLVLNQDTQTNAIANIAVNEGQLFIDGINFSTVGNFSNNGGLGLGSRDNDTTFTITGTLANFDPNTHTLSGGSYSVDVGDGMGTAILRFAGADIRTITNANVRVVGTGAAIRDLQGNSALRNLGSIQGGSFTSGGIETYTPSGGTLTNNGAAHTISPGAVITVQGNFNVTNGGSTIISAPTDNSNTVVVVQGHLLLDAGTSMDMGGQPNVNTQYHTMLQVINGIEYRGAFLTGTGTTFADILFTQNAHIQPGHSPGQLTVEGDFNMDGTTTTEMQLGGLSAGDEFDQLVQSQGTVTLGGKLQVSFVDGFEDSVTNDDTFDIITSDAMLAGSFSNIESGKRMATSDGKGTFIVTYSGDNKVTLSQFLPPPNIISVERTPDHYFKIMCHGYPEAGVYRLEASPDLDPNNFVGIVTIGTSDGTLLEFEDTNAGDSPRQFYRVVFPDAPLADRAPSKIAATRHSKR